MRGTISGLFGFALFGRCFTAFGLIALLGACATSERAEAIYLQQHRATTALTETIVAAEAEDPELAERLYGTESELDDACAPLRQAGDRKLHGARSTASWSERSSIPSTAARPRPKRSRSGSGASTRRPPSTSWVAPTLPRRPARINIDDPRYYTKER